MMAWLTIRTRLMLLTCAGLFVLIATNAYLTKKLAENSAGMVTAAELLKSIEEANSAQIAFGELRYWMTDLAVSQLTMAERSAAAAAVVIGSLLTFLILRSIVVPLRRLTVAMDGLNAGNVAVAIPEAGRDEIGAMAQTLAMFRDTLRELRETLAQLEALRAVGRAVGSTLDLEGVLSIVAARAVEFSHAQAGIIYEFDEEAREYRFRTSYGAEPALTEQLRAAPIRLGEGAIS